LHYAAENKDPLLAAFLIAMGAQVDAQDREQRTPLSISAENLDPATAKILADAGANIHYQMRGNTSPARIAVRENIDFLSALLNPESLRSIDPEGRAILHLATEMGNAEAVNIILRNGGSFFQRDRQGKTALDIALERTDSRNHAACAEYLILAGAFSYNPLYNYFAPAVRSSNYSIRSTDGMTPLHYIAREGFMGYLTFVLGKNADVNLKNASGSTPLHEAARSGNQRIIETLLDHGAEIDAQDAKGNSVLHIATPPEAQLGALNLFLTRGANINLRDEHGASPLHIATMLNSSEAVARMLLFNGADVNIRDVDGKTALFLAVEKNRDNYIPLLLEYKSDIFAADNNGITPYERAIRGNSSLVFLLITNETAVQHDNAGNTLLHLTVNAGGSTALLNYILDHNASINARNQEGDTALTMAVRLNQEASGRLLLSRGANIFASNTRGESPLFLTFPPPGGNPSELRQWMLNPQTLRMHDGLGNTALHYIAHWRFDSWIPLLIHMGANTEAANATGETPLFSAVKQDSTSTIRALINNGANLLSRDTLGNSALHAAVRWHAPRGAEELIDLGLDINNHALNGKTPLHDSIRLGILDIQMLLIRRGADIEVRDMEGNTPFMEAVLAGNQSVMELLVGLGADPRTRNFRGDTALHIIATMERPDLANLLLRWGASIHARNAWGRTPFQNALVTSPRQLRTFLADGRLNLSDDFGSSPLHIAIQERVSLTMINTIVEFGARMSSVDAEGRTPLRLAVDLDEMETAKLLADSGADVFVTARDGRNSAEIALAKGESAVLALFSGRAMYTSDSTGNTILHYAARLGEPSMISLLLSLGAQKDARNIAAESPAEIALRWRHTEAAALLN
jgi:hypothetical protein